MSSALSSFEVLHVIRLRGMVPREVMAGSLEVSVDDIQPFLDALVADGSVIEREGRRISGFVLTQDGRDRYEATMAAQVPVTETVLGRVYDSFLDMNGSLKRMCSDWQGIDDEVKRWDAIGDLETFNQPAHVVFSSAGQIVPRFARYARRLDSAVSMLNDGDERFFTSPLVDSYHTVWFEAHEDFLLSLGRDRAAEGSF